MGRKRPLGQVLQKKIACGLDFKFLQEEDLLILAGLQD